MRTITNSLILLSRHGIRWLRVSPQDKLFYANVLLTVWCVRLGLWIFPFQRILAFIERRGQSDHLFKSQRQTPFAIAQSVAAVANSVPSATCLTQSLTLIALLKNQGELGILRLGVSKDSTGRFLAHAWVEASDGALLSAHDSQGFLPLAIRSPLP